MDQFEDHFLTESPEGGLAIPPFDEEGHFFHAEEAPEGEEFAAQAPEESIYTDDPVRVYLREMGAVPLLTREGEVNLARRMERGKLRMQKAISRSALVQRMILEVAESIKHGEDIEDFVDLGDVEEGSAAQAKRQAEVQELFTALLALHKKQGQLTEKMNAVSLSNKKIRRRWQGKVMRSAVETSQTIRRIPWQLPKWRVFAREIEHVAEENASRE